MSLGLQTKAHTTALLQEECQRVSGNAGSCVTSPPESVFQRGGPLLWPTPSVLVKVKATIQSYWSTFCEVGPASLPFRDEAEADRKG